MEIEDYLRQGDTETFDRSLVLENVRQKAGYCIETIDDGEEILVELRDKSVSIFRNEIELVWYLGRFYIVRTEWIEDQDRIQERQDFFDLEGNLVYSKGARFKRKI